MRELLGFLVHVPTWLKQGPWSPVAYFVISSLIFFLGWTCHDALDSFKNISAIKTLDTSPIATEDWLQWYRLIVGLYCLTLSILVVRHSGYLPLCTYTITSWNLMTARLLLSYFGNAVETKLSSYPFAGTIAELIRFPALAGNSITVAVWWIVLAPLFLHFLKGEKRNFFWKFNFSPFLLHVHFLNLPICAAEFIMSGRPLQFHDLWMSLVVAVAYVLFYLTVLDPAGLQFYIILSPRTALCALPYAIVLSLYIGSLNGWNSVLFYFQHKIV